MSAGEVTLRIEPLEATTKEGEKIAVRLVFVGGSRDTTLVLPDGADPTGILGYRLTDVDSGREWQARVRDARSYAADVFEPLAAGARHEVLHRKLTFLHEHGWWPTLPAGRYRLVAVYDEGRAFQPAHRTSRVLRSEPVEITVTPP